MLQNLLKWVAAWIDEYHRVLCVFFYTGALTGEESIDLSESSVLVSSC
jgi:hypothetical protein